jgi:hypothetical protein
MLVDEEAVRDCNEEPLFEKKLSDIRYDRKFDISRATR